MKFCQNAFKIYASYVVFYMVFSDEVIRMGFLDFLSLLHHKKPVLTKLLIAGNSEDTTQS